MKFIHKAVEQLYTVSSMLFDLQSFPAIFSSQYFFILVFSYFLRNVYVQSGNSMKCFSLYQTFAFILYPCRLGLNLIKFIHELDRIIRVFVNYKWYTKYILTWIPLVTSRVSSPKKNSEILRVLNWLTPQINNLFDFDLLYEIKFTQ